MKRAGQRLEPAPGRPDGAAAGRVTDGGPEALRPAIREAYARTPAYRRSS